MSEEKPPLGIIPKYLWEENRAQDILNAMVRYSEKHLPTPREWIFEIAEYIANKEQS